MNILYTIRRAVQLFGDRAAIVHETGTVTYREFYKAAKRSARFLLNHFEPGERAAILMLNRPEYFELYYGTAIAGVVVVPLNIRWGLSDFIFTLNDSGSTALIVDERFAPFVPGLLQHCPLVKTILYAGDGDAPPNMVDYRQGVSSSTELEDINEPHPDDLAGLFYTSGTTGGPKAAMLSHGNLYSNAASIQMTNLPPSDVYLHAAPMFHLADIGLQYLCVNRGTAHAFIRAFDPELCLKAIECFKVTSLTLVPAMVNAILNHPRFHAYDVSSVHSILYGASPMPLPMLRRTRELFPRSEFFQAYGMTEMSPVVTMLDAEDHRRHWPEGKFNPLASAGRAVPGVEVRIIDDNDNEVPTGTPGEIIARGANRMLGYWKRDEINREVLRGGWMHTGDIGCFDDRGLLYIMDRKKDMIKTGGENVYSPEVEAALAAHPAVLEAAVIGMPCEKWGETIRAVVVLRPACTSGEEDLIKHCRENLTHFKCPTSVSFLESLPKGGTGKVQKNVLRQMYSNA